MGHTETGIAVKIQKKTTTITLAYFIIGIRAPSQTLSATPDDGSQPMHRPSPMLYYEMFWLRAGRVGACPRPLQLCMQQLN